MNPLSSNRELLTFPNRIPAQNPELKHYLLRNKEDTNIYTILQMKCFQDKCIKKKFESSKLVYEYVLKVFF